MKAVILEGINQPLKYTDVEKPALQSGEVLVKIEAAAFNHRDYWIQKGQYAGLRFPSIQGSDGSGKVELVADEEHQHWVGKAVVINPSLNWGNNNDTQAKDYIILGMAQDGTFAEYVKINAALIHEKPTHLTFEQAAALPLAGLTGYRALVTRAGAKAGNNVLVTGAGGGVALFCVQFALALGCNVYVTSGSDEKIAKAVAMGVKGGVNYKKENWHKELLQMSGGFDAIVDSACGDEFAKLVDLCKPAGRIAFYGATLGAFNSGVPAKIFWKQLTICGSTMGNNEEFAAMLKLVNDQKIVPVVDSVFPLADAQTAIEKMSRGEQFGKIVLKVN
ncbi:MAG: zinc-binding dehydrogenase [Bacteroidota bacterium]|jgi:zinc-binding alcohol dehydrogenase/oxidoreductase